MTRKTAITVATVLTMAAPLGLTFVPGAAFAQSNAQMQPAGVLSLSAQASAEVQQDVVTITLFYEQQASDPSSLTNTLNQRAGAALQRAKGVSGVTAHSGQFSVFPSTDRDGRISAWRGRTEVILESHDFAAASKLAGDLSSIMQVGNVQFSLSPEAQRTAERKLSDEAIASFRDQAAAGARAFGYSGYTIREVNINQMGTPRPMMAMVHTMAAEGRTAAPLSLEGGTSTVTVNVSGSVQMK